MDEFDEARRAFAQAYAIPNDSARAHLILAKILLEESANLNQAASTWARSEATLALKLDSHLPMAHMILGKGYMAKDDLGAALGEFQKEIELDPTSWLAYWELGNLFSRKQEWAQCEYALKRAIWLNQYFVDAYTLLGKVEMDQHRANLAIEPLETAVHLNPSDSSAHYLLGRAYKQLGQETQAEREFAITRSLNHDATAAHH